jgi:hypothetical protein
VEQLPQREPEPRKAAFLVWRRVRNQVCRCHVNILPYRQDTHVPGFFRSALYGWSVNRLETTPSEPLVSNLSESYNRNCGRGASLAT